MIFIGLFFVVLLFLLTLILGHKNNQGKLINNPTATPIASLTPTPTPIPVPSDFNRDYSNLNKLIPGKSTIVDVEKINGFPSSTRTSGTQTTMYYPTPSKEHSNVVVLENGTVKYALDNVFGNYRGNYGDYSKTYGQPDMHLYNSEPGNYFDWYVFLKYGFGIENSIGGITRIVYFAPQSKESFMDTIAVDIGLLATPSTPPPGVY